MRVADVLEQIVERVTFDVEFARRPTPEHGCKGNHVCAADVAAVRPRVHGDPVGAGFQHERGSALDARNAERARVAHQRHLVQIDAQGCHSSLKSCRMRRVFSGPAFEMVANQLTQRDLAFAATCASPNCPLAIASTVAPRIHKSSPGRSTRASSRCASIR